MVGGCDEVVLDVPLRVATPEGFKLIGNRSYPVVGYDADWRPIIQTRWGPLTLPDPVGTDGSCRYTVVGS